jgi:hypothetical protein
MKYASVVMASLALISCVTTGSSARPKEGPVAIGHSAQVGGLMVTPLKLVEDSRCPANTRCIWAGRVIVKTRIKGGNWSKVRNLELGKAEAIADGKITLSDVSPVKIVPDKLKLRNYRFSFTFEGGL